MSLYSIGRTSGFHFQAILDSKSNLNGRERDLRLAVIDTALYSR